MKIDLGKLIPRKIVYFSAIFAMRCMRIDYKNDIILYNELKSWTERNKSKWRSGWVGCLKCGYEWRAVHLLKSTHLECPKCHEMTQYSEISIEKCLNNPSDSDRLDWLEQLMTNDNDYCEIYFAGLRDFKKGTANSFQIESNPQKFKTVNASSIREVISIAMKNLLLILAVLLSVNCISQNRFEKVFAKADSAFSQTVDSVKFNQIIKEIEADTAKITLTTEECLFLYFDGYIDGSLNYRQKGSFDFDGLLREIKANRQSIVRYVRFKKTMIETAH